jgi:hypothetical protein
MYASQSVRADGSSFTAMSCTIVGNGNTITGHSNDVRGNNNTIVGHSNSVRGDNNSATGNSNTLKGCNNHALGMSNSVISMAPAASAPVPAVVAQQASPPLPHELIARESLLSKRTEVLQRLIRPGAPETAALTAEQIAPVLRLFAGSAEKLLDAWRYVMVYCKWFETHTRLGTVSRLIEQGFSGDKARVDAFATLWTPYGPALGANPPVVLEFVTRTLDAVTSLGQKERLLRLVLLQRPSERLTGTLDHVALVAPWLRHYSELADEWLRDQIQPRVLVDDLPLDRASEALAQLLAGACNVPDDWPATLEHWLTTGCWPYAVIIGDVIETLEKVRGHVPPAIAQSMTNLLDAHCRRLDSAAPLPPAAPAPDKEYDDADVQIVEPPPAKRRRITGPDHDLLADVIDQPARDEDDEHACVVCLERVRKVVLLPCRHFCLCGTCARAQQTQASATCPLCTRLIASHLPVF